jgi:deoxycytidylate deaminase
VTKKQLRRFYQAREEALRSDFQGQQVGCVIVLGNRVLARAHNSTKTHTEQAAFNIYRQFNQEPDSVIPRVHAEIAALSKCRYADVDWSKVELYVWRETKDERKYGNSSPCISCRAAIKKRGIRRVFYTGDESLVYEFIEGVM